MPFKSFLTEYVTLVKKDGRRFENLPAAVQSDVITTNDAQLPIEDGDLFERQLPSGITERFRILDAGFYPKFHGIDAHYQSKVRKEKPLPAATSSNQFPKLPKPALTLEILENLLDEVRRQGWPVFKDDYGRFVIETSANTQTTLEIVDGTCSIHFKNTLGPAAAGIAVETRDQLKEALRTITAPEPKSRRVLLTVLFTDIVDSTRKAAEMGDGPWRELLGKHDALIRNRLTEFSGREIDTAGDGFFATFDAPSLGVRAACAITTDVRRLGLQVRAGLHTGEVEMGGPKPIGLHVDIGARIGKLATGGEVWVSSRIKDLVEGPDFRFTDLDVRTLDGVPGAWHLFVVDHAEE